MHVILKILIMYLNGKVHKIKTTKQVVINTEWGAFGKVSRFIFNENIDKIFCLEWLFGFYSNGY